MDVKTLLGLAAAVGAGVLAHQDPSFEYPAVKPALATSPVGEAGVAESTLQKTISVRFKDASVNDVFDWLSNQGISFVTTDAPKNIKINLSLKDVPLGDAIDAIGDAMGGGWIQHGSVFIFQSGMQRSLFRGSRTMPELPNGLMKGDMEPFAFAEPQDGKKWEDYAKKMQKQFGEDSPFSKEMMKQFGSSSSFSKDQQKKWQDYAKQMQKQFGPGSAFQKQMLQDQKKWEQYGKDMQKQFGEGSPFQKQMQKQFKDGKFENFKWEQFKGFKPDMDFDFEKSMKFDKGVFDLSMKNHDLMLQDLDKKVMLENKLQLDQFMKLKMGDVVGNQDLPGLAKTLNSAQREKQKKQGFLYWSDLSAEQKRMLNMSNSAGSTWSISYSRDGESLTIKSDPKK